MSAFATSAKRPFLVQLGKDARLSLDVVRPWAAAIVGGGLLLVLVTRLPESLVGGIASTPVSQVFRLLAAFLMATAAPVAILLSAAIVQGDRVHGATILSAILPRGRVERGLSTTMAALAGASIVGATSIGASLLSQALRPEDSALRWTNDFGWLGVAFAFAGGGVGLWIAPLARRRWQAAILGCAVLAIAAAIGAVAARWMLPVVLPGLIGSEPPHANEAWQFERVFRLAANVGAIAGLCAVGAVGWLGGASGVLAPVRRAIPVLPWIALLPAIVLASAWGTRVVVRPEAIVQIIAYAERVVAELSPNEMTRVLERAVARSRGVVVGTAADDDLASRIVHRISQLPERERLAHPVTQWLEARKLENRTTLSFAIRARPRSDPARLRFILEACRHWHGPSNIVAEALFTVDPRWPQRVRASRGHDMSPLGWEIAQLEVLIASLERLLADPESALPTPSAPDARSTPIDAGTREAMAAALPVLRAELERLRPGSESEQPVTAPVTTERE